MSWLTDQWQQIRGNVKYEVLRIVVIALGGSGIVAALGAVLHRAFAGINTEWLIFGGIFCCSALVFSIGLFRPAVKALPEEVSTVNRVAVESLSETVKLGDFWQVPTKLFSPIQVELREIRNEREVVIEVTSIAIQYAGARVQTLWKKIQTAGYVMQRAEVDYGNDCVGHWDFGDASFSGYYIYLQHANPHTQEATLGFFIIDAYAPQPIAHVDKV